MVEDVHVIPWCVFWVIYNRKRWVEGMILYSRSLQDWFQYIHKEHDWWEVQVLNCWFSWLCWYWESAWLLVVETPIQYGMWILLIQYGNWKKELVLRSVLVSDAPNAHSNTFKCQLKHNKKRILYVCMCICMLDGERRSVCEWNGVSMKESVFLWSFKWPQKQL